MLKKRALHFGVSLILTALLLFAVFREHGIDGFISLLWGVDLSYLMIYLGLGLLGVCFRAVRYRIILDAVTGKSEVITISQAVIVTFIRNAFVDFLPARLGEVIYLYVLRRYGVSLVTGVSSFAICLVFDVVVVSILFLAAFAFSTLFSAERFSISSESLSLLSWLGIFLVVLLPFLVLLLLRYPDRILSMLHHGVLTLNRKWAGKKYWRFCSENIESFSRGFSLFAEAGRIAPLLVITFLLRLTKYSSLYFLLIAVVMQYGVHAQDLTPFRVLSAFFFAEASASLPVSGVMGFGAYEGVWTQIFSVSCEPCSRIPSVPSVAFAVHLITQVKGYSLGFLGLFVFWLGLLIGNRTGVDKTSVHGGT